MGLYQKIRPPRFKDMVGQETVTRNLLAQSKANTWFQVLIFGGMYGCGKTTAARITAMAVNCTNKDESGDPCGQCESCKAVLSGNCVDITEVDGASNTGVDNVRSLQEQASYLPMVLKKKVFIIDEVHMLSNSAFNSLLKTLEEPPAHCIFILCTTDVEKIPLTIRSRSACYTFGRIAESVIAEYLIKTAASQGIHISDDACSLLARRSDGSMRNALMLLEMVSGAKENISSEMVSEILGISEDMSVIALLKDMLSNDINSFIKRAGQFAAGGKNFYSLTGEMLSAATDLVVYLCSGSLVAGKSYIDALSNTDCSFNKACALSKGIEEMKAELRLDASENAFIVSGLKCMEGLSDKKVVSEAPKVAETPKNESAITEEISPAAETKEPDKEVIAEEKAEAKEEIKEENNFFGGFFDVFNLFGSSSDSPSTEFESIKEDDTPFDKNEGVSENENEKVDETNNVEAKEEKHEATETAFEPKEEEEEYLEYFKEKDMADSEFPFPAFLKSSEGLSLKAKRSFYALREICKNERSINSNLTNGFRMESTNDGLILIGKDMTAFQSVLIVMSRYELPNTEIRFE